MKPIIINDEQQKMINRLQEVDAQLSWDPFDITKIPMLRALLQESYSINVPPIAYAGIRSFISLFDTEMNLPPYLRNPKIVGLKNAEESDV